MRSREHTSLIPPREQVELENDFKSSAWPDAPNVLTCTPTLELGIDIGDLSTSLSAVAVPTGQ